MGVWQVLVFILHVCFDGGWAHAAHNGQLGANASNVVYLFRNSTPEINKAFELTMHHFENSFDYKLLQRFRDNFGQGLDNYRQSSAYTSYAFFPDRPHCDKGEPSPAMRRASQVDGLAPFPGGIVKRIFGFDFGKHLFELSASANGPASAGLVPAMALASQGLSVGAGLVQSVVAAVVHTVPPLIPPPAWNNMPLACAPMVSGHNCFGAVLYPITMADFVLADVTDSMLDGVIAGFPTTYAAKVGKTSDQMYKACFASLMSMHCSSIFPRCTTPQARDEPIPVGGRVPMCMHLCIVPLVMCPGFWIGDMGGSCSMVSVPPMCTQAFYWNMWRLPPQYSSYDEANPYPIDCPRTDFSDSGLDAVDDPTLYDDQLAPASPILEEAAKLPSVGVF